MGLLAGCASQGSGDDPGATLADIVAFTSAASSVHVASTITATASSYDGTDTDADAGAGPGAIHRGTWRSEADVRFPADARVRFFTDDRVLETIVLGEDAYQRSAVAEVNLYLNEWRVSDARSREPVAGAGTGGSGGGKVETWRLLTQGAAFADDTRKLQQVLALNEEPARVSTGVIRATIPIRALLTLFLAGTEIEPVEGDATVALTSSGGGRLDRMVIDIDARTPPAWRWTADLRFTGWGKPVDIAAPEVGTFDDGVAIEAERIAGAPFTVLAPKAVPSDLKLLEASFFDPSERSLTEADCGKVTLYYANPAEEQRAKAAEQFNKRFLNLDITSVACETDDQRTNDAYLEKRAGAPAPYRAGPHRGTMARYDTPEAGRGAYIVLVVDGVDVFVDSTLSDEETARALGELVPFDLATQPL